MVLPPTGYIYGMDQCCPPVVIFMGSTCAAQAVCVDQILPRASKENFILLGQ